MSHLNYHLAQLLIDEQLQVTSERRRAKASSQPATRRTMRRARSRVYRENRR
jgi:hypothetical protein